MNTYKLTSTIALALLVASCAEVEVLQPGDPQDFLDTLEDKPLLICPDDDANEPNDVPGAAPVMHDHAAGIRCGNNDDYYAFDVPFAGCTTRGTLQAAAAGLELAILDTRGIELTRGPAVEFTAPEGGRYYARIFGQAEAAYSLDLNVACPDAPPLECPADDPAEPNDDEANAQPISTAVQGIVCADNDDFYTLQAEAGCELSVGLFFAHADGDLDIQVRGPDGGFLGSGTSVDDDESVSVTTTAAGPHHLRVYGVGAAEAEYSLSVDLRCGAEIVDPGPDPDPEPELGPNPADAMCPAGDGLNESADSPFPLDNASVDAVVCSGDSDYFDVFVSDGCVMTADLTFTDAHGDLDLELKGPGGDVEDRSVSTTDNERVVETAETTGLQVLRVYAVGSAQNAYTLTTQITCRDALNCTDDDPYESPEAWTLDSDDRATGIVCGTADRDTYEVRVDSRCATRAAVDFTHADGDIDLTVKQGAETVARGTSVTDDELVFFGTSASSTYELELRRFSADNHYTLDLDTRCFGELNCTDDDVFAPNKSSAQARDISQSGYAVGITCNGGSNVSEDWYSFRATAGCQFNATLDNTEVTSGDVDLRVLDPSGAEVGTSLTGNPTETVSFNAASTGDYKVKVEGFVGAEGKYELTVSCQ